MSAAVATVEALRTPLLAELEDVLGMVATLPSAARSAVATIAISLAEDAGVSGEERALAAMLLVLTRALD